RRVKESNMHKWQPLCRPGQRLMGGAIYAAMAVLALASCAPTSTVPPTPPAPRPAVAYRIGPGDVLDILVWREETVSGPVTVRSDRMISVSLVGDVKAEGLTPEELAAELEKDLLRFIETPKVVVRVATSGRHFYIIGNVRTPGMFTMLPQQTLLQAIALCGG